MESTSTTKYPIICDDSVMDKKKYGTSNQPVQKNLRWGCDSEEASRIGCYNRHFAEHSGYWQKTSLVTDLRLKQLQSGFTSIFSKNGNNSSKEITFYDSVTGKPVFIAPRGRTISQFKEESINHGWPSFRDEEVVWENVRCLSNGETVSLDGTHLGHNLPDEKGNRYCINLVCIAGRPINE